MKSTDITNSYLPRQLSLQSIRKILADRGYYVSKLGLITQKEGDYDNNLGEIRVVEKAVVISPSQKALRPEALRLRDYLDEEKVRFRDRTKYN